LGLNLSVIGDNLQIGYISFTTRGDLSSFKKKGADNTFQKKKNSQASELGF
jgi:hypothetical protein